MSEILKIIAEPQMEPGKCKFILDKPLCKEGSYRFNNLAEANKSPLAYALFQVPGVSSVFIAAGSIMITANTDTDWRESGKLIGAAIREALAKNEAVISDELKQKLPSQDEVRKKVMQVIMEEINPAVASHGGYIELLDVRHNDIFIKMGGGCQGCAMSAATLKQGVENALRKAIPELGSIYDTTDHAAGLNPFYSP